MMLLIGSKLRCIDLFCGGGGSTLGFHEAGIEHVLLLDNNKDSCRTIKANLPEANVVCADIASFDFNGYKNIDIVFAGFPCQPFSYAGLKRGFRDVRGSVFYEIIKCLWLVSPEVVVLENVKGLLNHEEGRTLKEIIHELKRVGYGNFLYKVLNAKDYSVAQSRERLFIVAFKNEDVSYYFPVAPIGETSLRSILKDVPASEGSKYSEKKAKILDMIPEGGNWKSLPLDVQKEYLGKMFYSGGGKTGIAKRLSWDSPSPTILATPSQKQTERCHPSETRPLTIRESARIQSFPDSWVFKGSVASQYRQIGNAVPVKLAKAIAESIKLHYIAPKVGLSEREEADLKEHLILLRTIQDEKLRQGLILGSELRERRKEYSSKRVFAKLLSITTKALREYEKELNIQDQQTNQRFVDFFRSHGNVNCGIVLKRKIKLNEKKFNLFVYLVVVLLDKIKRISIVFFDKLLYFSEMLYLKQYNKKLSPFNYEHIAYGASPEFYHLICSVLDEQGYLEYREGHADYEDYKGYVNREAWFCPHTKDLYFKKSPKYVISTLDIQDEEKEQIKKVCADIFYWHGNSSVFDSSNNCLLLKRAHLDSGFKNTKYGHIIKMENFVQEFELP